MTYLGADTVDGGALRKFGQAVKGVPGTSILWADAEGRTVQMTMDSPFGPIRIAKGASPEGVGARLPDESYESTLAISNIRLPHPRDLERVTVELNR